MVHQYSDEQAQIFGEDAALYDRFRPSYPRELMEAVVSYTGDLPVLEIGAGTGKATKALLALGKTVHALEPDHRMAALLDLNCKGSAVKVEGLTLEAAILPPAGYDLVVAAQSWHWIDGGIGYDLAADALVPDGMLALLWHHPHPEQGLFGSALEQLYAELIPDMPHLLPGEKAIEFDPANEPPAAMTRFRNWDRLEHRWKRRLDSPSMVGWLCSSSDHRLLPVEQRTQLMSGVAALVNEMGGEVVVNMTTVAHLAQKV